MLTTHGVAVGEWLGEEWRQYRWPCKVKDIDVLYWLHLPDLESLEKEGKQKPADKIEPKFKDGDWITNGEYTWKIVEVNPLNYILQSQDGNIVDDTISHVDEHFHLWTIQDAKDGDVLFTKKYEEPNIVFILKGRVPKDCVCRYYCYYNIMYPHFATDELKGCLAPKCADLMPATKEQRDLLFQKIKEAGYEWDSESKQLLSLKAEPIGEHKPVEWSEEDDRMLQKLVCGIGCYTVFGGIPSEDFVKWLKSLKQKFKWSDENPKEGLIDINKAAEWLQHNTMSELCLDLGYTQMVRDFIDNFKKAMEE